jgi:fibronectin type 3 domain-containing protein
MLLASLGTGIVAGLSLPEPMASGPASGTLTVAILDPPAPPGNLWAEAGDGWVALHWDAADPLDLVTGYNIYRGECQGCESRYDSILLFTDYTDDGVTNGVTYWYYVTAVNAFGESDPSNEVSATPGGPPPPPPPEVPGPPRNLNAVAGDATVYLTWQAPEKDGGSPITNYHIYRGASPDQVSRIDTVGDVLEYTNTGLTNGETYWYRVSAQNDVGEGRWSNAASATPEAPPSPPGPPVDLRATPGDGSVQLDWSAPTDDGGSPITNYNIYRGTTSGQLSFLVQVPDVLTYQDTGLTNGQKYFYHVRAVNSQGEGPPSHEVSATPMSGDTAPEPPTNLVAIGGDTRVSLSWQAPPSDGGSPVTNYNIYRGTSPGGEAWLAQVGGDARSYTDTAVTNGVTYYYYVTAVNGIGESGPSNEAPATPGPAATVPEAPRSLRAEPRDRAVQLTWEPPANDGGKPVTNYRIYRGITSGDRSTVTTVGAVTSYTDVALNNSQRYYYVVTAINEIGEGPPSNEADAIPATVPSAPRNLRAIPGDEVITIQWSGPETNGGSPVTNYRIYRGTAPENLAFVTMVGPIDTYTDGGLTNGQIYYYQVSAVNRVGEGVRSELTSATPGAGPGPPGAPPTLVATAGNNSVRLEWTAPEDTGGPPILNYTVYRSTDVDNLTAFADAGNNLVFLDSTVTNGVTYYYQVTATNAVGEGPRGPVAMATPRPGPDRASPSVGITPPQSGGKLTAGQRTVYGYAADDTGVKGVQVRVDDQAWVDAVGTSRWSVVLTLTEGLHTIYAIATDVENKTGTTNLTITVEPGGPGTSGGPLANPGTMLLALAVGSFVVSAVVAFVILDRRRRFWKNVLGESSRERSLFKDEFFDEAPQGESEHHRHRGRIRDHRLRP